MPLSPLLECSQRYVCHSKPIVTWKAVVNYIICPLGESITLLLECQYFIIFEIFLFPLLKSTARTLSVALVYVDLYSTEII